MRKSTKYLVMSGMALFSGIGAFAQTPKSCDLQPRVVTPVANAIFNFGDTLKLKFTIKNNGPAAIVPADTIYYQSSALSGVEYTTGKNIASGDSTTIDLGSVGTNNNTTSADQMSDICVALINQSSVFRMSGTDTVWAVVSYNDNVAANNSNCNNVTFKKKPSVVGIFDLGGIETETLSIYPNPANDKVTFDIALEKSATVTATVRDMVGRTVIAKDFGKVQAGNATPFNLGISKLTAGVYFVEVTIGERKLIGKITKQN